MNDGKTRLQRLHGFVVNPFRQSLDKSYTAIDNITPWFNSLPEDVDVLNDAEWNLKAYKFLIRKMFEDF